MSLTTNAWHPRIKAAQRDLIEMCGGIDRVVLKTSVSKSQVGRWNNRTDPDLMPISSVLVLEADCGMALITSAMAELNGYRVEDPERAEKATGSVLARHAETVRQAGELMAAGAAAFADGKLTPAELQNIGRVASSLNGALAELQRVVAAAQNDGTLRVVGN